MNPKKLDLKRAGVALIAFPAALLIFSIVAIARLTRKQNTIQSI